MEPPRPSPTAVAEPTAPDPTRGERSATATEDSASPAPPGEASPRPSPGLPAGAVPLPREVVAPGPDPASGAASRLGAHLHDEPHDAIDCLLEVTQELNASTDLAEGLKKVAERLKHHVEYDTLGVLLLDDRGRELRFVLAEGFPPQVEKHWRFGMGQGIVGTAAATQQPVLVEDVSKDPRYINASETVRSELALPLIAKDRTVGVLDIGSSVPGKFTAEDQKLLGFLAGHLANAIENSRLYQNMREQAHILSVLHEVGRELASILDRKQLLERVADLVGRMIDFDLFTVMLWNEERQVLEPWLSVFRDGLRQRSAQAVPLGQGITGTAAALRQPLRVPNTDIDPRFLRCSENIEVKSELVAPLIFKDRLLGVLDLESAEYDAFRPRHEQLLSTLAATVAIALENARLYEMLRADEERLDRDLSAARELQKRLLPKATPWLPGVQIGVSNEPARHLGGDFYDFLPCGEGRLGIAVGDVAGKATSAALYGSLAIGTLREFAGQNCAGPADTLGQLNERLRQLGLDNRFVALAFASYESAGRRLTLANSGLPYPYLVRRGEARRLKVGGVPLGLLPERSYDEIGIELEPGDAVVIASDGIEECLDARGEELGAERVEATLERLSGASAQEMALGLLEAARAHAGSAETSDDRTVVVLRLVED